MCVLIEDEQIKLVPYTHDDDALMYKCFKNKQTQLGFNYIPSKSHREYSRTLNLEHYKFWAVIVLKKTNQKIGSLKLSPFESNPDLSIFLLRKYRHKGLGTRAYYLGLRYCFSVLDLPEVVAGCYEENPVSKRMLEKLNFKRNPSHDLVERSVFTGERIKQYAYQLEKTAFLSLTHSSKLEENDT